MAGVDIGELRAHSAGCKRTRGAKVPRRPGHRVYHHLKSMRGPKPRSCCGARGKGKLSRTGCGRKLSQVHDLSAEAELPRTRFPPLHGTSQAISPMSLLEIRFELAN